MKMYVHGIIHRKSRSERTEIVEKPSIVCIFFGIISIEKKNNIISKKRKQKKTYSQSVANFRSKVNESICIAYPVDDLPMNAE